MASKNRRKKRRARGGAYILLTVVLTLAAVIVGIGLFFRVGYIEVSGNELYKSDEIINDSGVKTGDNLLTLDNKAISQKLKSKMPYIENVDTVKTYPATVTIKVEENAPIAYTKIGGQTWMLNTDCRLFEAEKAADVNGLIKLTGADISDPVTGETAVSADGKNQMKFVRELLTAIRENNVEKRITAIDVTNIGSITFDLDGRFDVNLGSDGEISSKIAMLLGAINKIDSNSKGRLEFTTDIELHFMPEE